MRNAGGNLTNRETQRPPPGFQPGKKPDTCTTNEISARIPHPALRATFPRGEGFVVLLPSVGVRLWDGGLGRCGHRPLRRGWGCGNSL